MTDKDESRKSIVRCIKKVRAQLILRALLSDILLVVTGACILCAMLLAFSLLIPIAWIWRYLCIIWGICILAGIILRAGKLPDDRDASLVIDSTGLEERCITALELMEDDSRVAHLQAADAAAHIEKADREGKLKVNVFPGLQRAALAVAALAGAILIFFVPSPARQKAEEYEQLSLVKKEKEDEIEKLYNALDETLDLQQISDEDREQIRQMMSDLEDRLEAVSKADSMQALSKAEAKRNLERDKMSMHLQQMADNLEGGESETINDAADMLADNDA
ncbi:MAG: hypothetical protein J5842_01195, partial [Lachnospiraceae bacterium]|nr:hypothetical protein [Lachnospiraceae bacterium]